MFQVKPPIDVNCPADTGNTPLHAAANNGNVNLVTILLQNPRIDINSKNPQCEDATPLHLAIMLGKYSSEISKCGFTEMCILLFDQIYGDVTDFISF